MVLEMNRCSANWQKSGQGEGGINDADNEVDQEFGSLENRSQTALANRQNFFCDRQLYLLYLWEMLNKHDLLSSALQKLNNTMSLANGASGVPLVLSCALNDNVDLMSEQTKPTSAGINLVMALLGKSIEKHGQTLIDVARIDAKQKVTLTKMQEEENEKEWMHQECTELRGDLCKLQGEKQSLKIQHAAEVQKKYKVMVEIIMDELKEVMTEIEKTTKKLESLEKTMTIN